MVSLQSFEHYDVISTIDADYHELVAQTGKIKQKKSHWHLADNGERAIFMNSSHGVFMDHFIFRNDFSANL